MKNIYAVSAALLVTAVMVTSCAPVPEHSDIKTPITVGPDAFTSIPEVANSTHIANASLSLQTFFQSINEESESIQSTDGQLDYSTLESDFERTLSSLHKASIAEEKTVKVVNEYVNYLATIPENGYVGIDPKTLKVSEDGTVKITGADLFIVYKDGSEYVRHEGASMSSEGSLNDVFTLSEIEGEWKLTEVVL